MIRQTKKAPIFPPAVREVSDLPEQQEVEYTYKVTKKITIKLQNYKVTRPEITTTYMNFLHEDQLVKDFETHTHKLVSPSEERLKNILTEGINDEIYAANPKQSETELKKRIVRREIEPFYNSLTYYLMNLMTENVLYFIQHIAYDSYNTPTGTITRRGNEIHYEVVFAYTQPDDIREFGKYKVETVPPPYTLSPFEDKEVPPCPTGVPLRTSTMALTRPDLWTSDEKKLPHFIKEFNKAGLIEHFIEAPEELSEGQKEQWLKENAWNIVKNLEKESYAIETAYINLIYSTYAMSLNRPWDGEIKIKGSDIIKILGWDKKKRHVRKADLLKEIYKIARNACRFGTGGYWNVGKNRFTIERGPHWVFMGEMWTGQLTFDGGADNPTELYITIRPGMWTKYFLNKDGHKEGSALYQFGYIAKKTLQISVSQEPLAAKLALYLTTMVKEKEKDFDVENLLRTILTDCEFIQALNVKEKTHTLKTQWDNALLRLREIGWGIRFDSSYPYELLPSWERKGGPSHPRLPRNYIHRLLAAKLWFIAPAASRNLIQAPVSKKRKQRVMACLKGIDVKKAREARKWSTHELAKLMGKSQTWVSMIEKGDRPITKENEKRLIEILTIKSPSEESSGHGNSEL